MAASAAMQGWELTALFLVFLFITLFWDFMVGFLTFLNNILRGRKANWLARVKDELLALGVVSLVLLFMEPSLQKICMPSGKGKSSADGGSPSYPPSPPPEYGTYYCDAGYRQVFPKTVIHAAHYLLFYLAIVHILFSLLTSVITNVKLAKWSALERTARKEQNIPAVAFLRISSVIDRANDPATYRPSMRVRETWRDIIGYVDQDLYSLLRFMCEKRFRAHSVVLRNFNFLNMCEQCLEAELNEVYSHAWLLVFMMALLLLYNRRLYQMVWISFVCAAMMALMAGNMRWVMKKTAREARNLWRKVQGMGGLERDDDGEEQSSEEQAAAPEGKAGGGGEAAVGTLASHAALMHQHHQQLLLLQQQQQQLHLQQQRQQRQAGGSGGMGPDLEVGGDVAAPQRMDQQHLAFHAAVKHNTGLELTQLGHLTSVKRPAKQLRFEAPTTRPGVPGRPGPLGESLEEGRQDSKTSSDVLLAAGPATGSCDVAAAAAAGGGGEWWESCHTGGRACWSLAAGAPGRCPAPLRGDGGGGGGSGLLGLLEVCREKRTAAAPEASGGVRRYSHSCSSSSRTASRYYDRTPWWQHASCRGEGGGSAAPASARRGVAQSTATVAAAAATTALPWSGRPQLTCPPRLLGGGGSSGGGGGGGSAAAGEAEDASRGDGGSGSSSNRPGAAGCRKRVVGRGSSDRCPGPGPVGEGMMSNNPLYGMNNGGDGGLGQGSLLGVPSLGYALQLGMPPQWYGNGVAVPGPGVCAASGPSSSALVSPSYGIQVDATAAAHAFGAANLIAATAASPYGGSAAAVAAAAPAPPPTPTPTPPAAADNGQWGSNPSSGAPDEADDAASAGSGSGSGSHSSSDEHRTRKGAPHGHGRGGKKDAQGHEDDEEDVHSEKSILEHELASGIEEKITRLFFFGRPFLLLWLFNIIFAQASLIMTMSMAFVIPYDKFDYIRDVAMPMYIWLPVVLTNLLLVFYGCWVFLPQYALLSVCGILEPHEVMHEIKRSKTADKVEEGISAIVLEKMTDYFIGRHDGETRLSTAFIVNLASQAGIILGRDYKAQKHINKVTLKPMYKEFMMVWHDIAWYGELTASYMIKSDVPEFKAAFDELDEDGSGALSFGELANMIRSLGTYATAGDVEAMLWEIDIDNSHSIGFDEFVKFMVYAFFDTKQLGWIDMPALMDAMERLGMPVNEMQAAVLMSVGHCEPGEEVKVTLRQFFGMFEKVVFEEGDTQSDDADGAGKTSFMDRARDLLSFQK